tara:strand:- start:97 stop:567 length:471 start_codon:yes stop_codon:yes gene_type:complete
MNNLIETLFPKKAENSFKGYKIIIYTLLFFNILFFLRSLVHLFFDDAGLMQIAGYIPLEGVPDPNEILYFFGHLWGLNQFIISLIGFIIIFRYNNLVPLLWFIYLIQLIGGPFISLLIMESDISLYFSKTPPGSHFRRYGAIIFVIFSILSLFKKK